MRGASRALVLANARFWPSVAPSMWRELARWRAQSGAIEQPALRALAGEKLASEAFNAEVAATLATLAPRAARAQCVSAIVALEVLFDYLDGRTETQDGAGDRVEQAERQLSAIANAVDPGAERWTAPGEQGDGGYIEALNHHVAEHVATLPSFAAVRKTAVAAGRRCAQAQARLHAAGAIGDRELEAWACEASAASGLGWREYIAGCASSVLAMHALIAAAGRTALTAREAQAIDQTYLAIGALITMLDSTVDETEDHAIGAPGYIRLFAEPGERAQSARALVRVALARAAASPDGSHHAMTLAGAIAYYASHPGARSPAARPVVAAVRREIGPALWPTLAVVGSWRAAKGLRDRVRVASRRRRQTGSGGRERRQT
jgi:tetraprenyl-beta-curcumene synthase